MDNVNAVAEKDCAIIAAELLPVMKQMSLHSSAVSLKLNSDSALAQNMVTGHKWATLRDGVEEYYFIETTVSVKTKIYRMGGEKNENGN